MRKWLELLEDRLHERSRVAGRLQGAALRGLRYPVALLRDWLADDINVQATSLAYTTLLSIVPLMAFTIALLKGLGTHANISLVVSQLLRPVGGAAAELTASAMQVVDNMRGDVLGSVSFVFLAYTVVTTIQKVETSFHLVWRIARPRSLLRRVIEYLVVMIVGPILLAAALGVVASAQNSPLAHWLDAVAPGHSLSVLAKGLPYLVVTLVFTAMYFLIPNTRVQLGAAVIGGVSAGILWALVGRLFTTFILYSSQATAVYTGFAVVLTTLIWIYLSWLILLLGAQLAFYVQFPQYLREGRDAPERSAGWRERTALSIMVLLGRDHGRAEAQWTVERLAQQLDVPAAALSDILDLLQQAGLVTAAGRRRFVASREPARTTLAEVWRVARAEGRSAAQDPAQQAALALTRQIDAVVAGWLAERTLAELIAAPAAEKPRGGI